MNNSPFQTLLDNADNIQRVLADDTGNMALAIEAKLTALQAHREAQAAYDEAEAEFTFIIMFGGDGNYAKAKNAETRKLVLDLAIIEERSNGTLAQPWRILNRTRTDLDNAAMAYDQAEARFKAVRVAAELQGAMLLGLAADAKLLRG
jgi:hypothetical protein